MFTGLVEALGSVVALARNGEGARLSVTAPFARDVAVGESVAIDGCCLTHRTGGAEHLDFDLSRETLARTTLGSLMPGSTVNLERALRLGDRLGGHVMLGHVDGIERVIAVTDEEGGGRRLRFSVAHGAATFVAPKGSVAVSGVSLTVASLGQSWFEVAAIPHTLAVTTLGRLVVRSAVNVEFDVLQKASLRAAGFARPEDLPLDVRTLLGLEDAPGPGDE